MANPSVLTFDLHLHEKILLNAFIRGTTLSENEKQDGLWTTEALTGLQAILDGTMDPDAIPPHLVQDLLCVFADLITRKDSMSRDAAFTQIMVKFMHYLISLIDWTRKRKPKGRQGRKAIPTVSLSLGPLPPSPVSTEIAQNPTGFPEAPQGLQNPIEQNSPAGAERSNP
jgi:hypothetical protein